jgi:hypothetical protein
MVAFSGDPYLQNHDKLSIMNHGSCIACGIDSCRVVAVSKSTDENTCDLALFLGSQIFNQLENS